MAIYLTDKDGSDQHFDTYAEFEQAMVLMSRIGGNKVPQDLLDEVKAKYGDKDPEPFRMRIDGNNFESAFREAVRDVGEELGRLSMDRTPVSDECENPEKYPKFEVGDKVRVVSADDGTSDPYHGFTIGSTVEVEVIYGDGKIEAYNGNFHQTLLPQHFEKADVEEKTFKVGDKVKVTGNSAGHALEIGDIREIREVDSEEPKYNLSHLRLDHWANTSDIELVDSPTEFRTGDIVKVTKTFKDIHGDVAEGGTVCVYDERFESLIFVGSVILGDNHDKLQLVCRKEDRKDIGL